MIPKGRVSIHDVNKNREPYTTKYLFFRRAVDAVIDELCAMENEATNRGSTINKVFSDGEIKDRIRRAIQKSKR
jgi:hypothetical protein